MLLSRKKHVQIQRSKQEREQQVDNKVQLLPDIKDFEINQRISLFVKLNTDTQEQVANNMSLYYYLIQQC